jgi:hypothetical protein
MIQNRRLSLFEKELKAIKLIMTQKILTTSKKKYLNKKDQETIYIKTY